MLAPAALGAFPALEHVHGFHAAAKPPAVFLSEVDVAVAAGTLVVVVSVEGSDQRFIYGHTDAVTTLAYSHQQTCGASGQLLESGARFAPVHIWNPLTLETYGTILFHQADIEAVGFVQHGEVLVTIAADRDHTLALWAIVRDGAVRVRRREKAPLAVCSAYKSGNVHGISAAPSETVDYRSLVAGTHRAGALMQFVTFGTAHVKFWQSGRLKPSLSSRRGAFGSQGTPKAVVTVAWTSKDQLVAGCSDGEIFVFEGTVAARRLQKLRLCVVLLHTMSDLICAVYSNGTLSALGADGKAAEVDISSASGAPDARISSPYVAGSSFRSAILLVSRTHMLHCVLGAGSPRIQACKTLMAQSARPLTDVCAHHIEPRIYSGSLDACIRCYRSDTHQPVPERSFRLAAGVTCMALSGSAQGTSAWLAVGCEDSTLCILGEEKLRYVFRRCLSASHCKITCAQFSLCDASGTHPLWLAVGTEEGAIHTFRFKDAVCTHYSHTGPEIVAKASVLSGHSAGIFNLSFAQTLPCVYLHSMDVSGQALVFDVPMGRRIPSMDPVRELSPWTSPIGWQVAGCWTADREAAKDNKRLPPRRFCELVGRGLVAAANLASPTVQLFPFPCPRKADPVAELIGPAVPASALLHGTTNDCLLAASDTVLLVWSCSASRQPVPPQDEFEAAPRDFHKQLMDCPPRQVQFSTPEKRNAQEDLQSPPSAVKFTPPKRALRHWDVPAPNERQDVATALQESAKVFSTPQKDARGLIEPGFAAEGQPNRMRSQSSPPAAQPAMSEVSGKIGAQERQHVVANTMRIREDTEARARTIHERHRFDTVGLLLSGQADQGHAKVKRGWDIDAAGWDNRSTGVAAMPGEHKQGESGRFLYRVRDNVSAYEVEVHLPAGQLTRVLRNPMRRTLTFQGEIVDRWAVGEDSQECEKVIIGVPSGFDLSATPHVEQDFESGRCLIVVPKREQPEKVAPCSNGRK
mmetsp:Transcript_43564/g.100343  ORF Transcript_43564/g.100343 Transcript_43564/m.100343 type:complete len:975 (-) Transcript_43564:88-3012(-)